MPQNKLGSRLRSAYPSATIVRGWRCTPMGVRRHGWWASYPSGLCVWLGGTLQDALERIVKERGKPLDSSRN
jgi:hypothetical protein